jgi:ankyrin repeat protein
MEQGSWEAVRILLENGANTDRETNGRSSDLLHYLEPESVVLWGHLSHEDLDLVRLLVERSANVNERESDGIAPLHWAVQGEFYEITEVLLEHSADPDAEDDRTTAVRDPIAPSNNATYSYQQRKSLAEILFRLLVSCSHYWNAART